MLVLILRLDSIKCVPFGPPKSLLCHMYHCAASKIFTQSVHTSISNILRHPLQNTVPAQFQLTVTLRLEES